MKTKNYTVKTKKGSATVSQAGDIWEIPGVHILFGRTTKIMVRVAGDGIACDPMTEGFGADQKPENLIEIEAGGGPIKGWDDLDDDESYFVAGLAVPATVLEAVAKWSGLCLPVGAK